MSSVQEEVGTRMTSNTPRDTSNGGGCAGAELVSRLLAATPPYLYAAPPHHPHHAFFFSEMLRSFVNARARHQRAPAHAEPPHHSRRAKKRVLNSKMFGAAAEGPRQDWQPRGNSWNLPAVPEKRTLFDEKEKFPEINVAKMNYERPLELTINKHNLLSQHRFDLSPKDDNSKTLKTTTPEPANLNEDKAEQRPPLEPQNDASNAPTSDIILPPPPPMWYPPLYPPPYGMDPLNFFIDLRVSGHIYDRKLGAAANPKDITANVPNQSAERPEPFTPDHLFSSLKDSGRPHRHASAFSVPKPRAAKGSPVNLCQPANKFNMKYFDDVDLHNHERRLASERNTHSAHYVMHNLKRIYGHLGSQKLGNRDDKLASKQEMADDLEASDSSDGVEKKNRRLRSLMEFEEFPKRDSGSESGGSDDDVIVSGESHALRD